MKHNYHPCRRALPFLAVGLSLFLVVYAHAQIVCDFSSQKGERDEASPNAFPGCAGDGWQGPWQVRRYSSETEKKNYRGPEGVSVVEVPGVQGQMLKVGPAEKFEDKGVGVARGYGNSGGLDITKPYLISCVVRIDHLPALEKNLIDNGFFIGENATDTVGQTSSSAWFLLGGYGIEAGKSLTPNNKQHRMSSAKQRQWNLSTVNEGDEVTYVPTEIMLEDGGEYAVSVTIDPVSSSYRCQIKGGGGEFVSDVLRFPKDKPLGKNLVFGSRHSVGDSVVFSVGDIKIANSDW